MARHPLLGGSYSTRSVIASAQRRINYYPERNPRWALVPVTHYQRPGLTPISNIGTGPIRALYRLSTGVGGYVVSGTQVYALDGQFNPTLMGNLINNVGTPVSIIDNGIEGVLVDNSAAGWWWNINNPAGTFQTINDPLFVGATRADTIDTFILFNQPNTNHFISTLSNQIVPFDQTYIASKSDYPDPIQTLIVNRHEIL